MVIFTLALIRFIRGIKIGLGDPQFRSLFLLVVLLIGIGTVFYCFVEHWKVLDAFYFSVVTLATVGYGDFVPKTDLGKLFTVLYIFLGIGTLISFATLLQQKTAKNKLLKKRL